jgi:hypothetical protein
MKCRVGKTKTQQRQREIQTVHVEFQLVIGAALHFVSKIYLGGHFIHSAEVLRWTSWMTSRHYISGSKKLTVGLD